jgi:hypothetical protein
VSSGTWLIYPVVYQSVVREFNCARVRSWPTPAVWASDLQRPLLGKSGILKLCSWPAPTPPVPVQSRPAARYQVSGAATSRAILGSASQPPMPRRTTPLRVTLEPAFSLTLPDFQVSSISCGLPIPNNTLRHSTRSVTFEKELGR